MKNYIKTKFFSRLMKISFFEEFPTPTNLSKLRVVNWPTKIYLAAPSLAEFKEKQKTLKKKVKEIIYWPILSKKEGYWISPFSQTAALRRIFQELKNKEVPVMLDLELPTSKNPLLYFTELVHFQLNKKIIKKFIHNYSGQIYLTEYYPEGQTQERRLAQLGLHYPTKKVKIIKMLYHSLHHFTPKFLREELLLGKKEYGDNYLVGFGTIAKGINGNEAILSSAQLLQDLQIARESKIKEVVIFRLGGFNHKFKKTLQKLSKTTS